MEEKIYDRQVTKQSLANRVVDQQQIERHFTLNELTELYMFKPDLLDSLASSKRIRVTPAMPQVSSISQSINQSVNQALYLSQRGKFKRHIEQRTHHTHTRRESLSSLSVRCQDFVLAQLLQTCKDQIVSFHEHESLLDHKEDEELSEAERKAAWDEYEAEVRSCVVASPARWRSLQKLQKVKVELLVSHCLFWLLSHS